MQKPNAQWALGRTGGSLTLTHLPTGAQIYTLRGRLVHDASEKTTAIHDLEAHDNPDVVLLRLARELNACWVGIPDPQQEPIGRR